MQGEKQVQGGFSERRNGCCLEECIGYTGREFFFPTTFLSMAQNGQFIDGIKPQPHSCVCVL